jgi:membrane-associated phospholipid phosphatase
VDVEHGAAAADKSIRAIRRVAMNERTSISKALAVRGELVIGSLTRPYTVTWSMVALMVLVPFYLVIAQVTRSRLVWHAPQTALDALLPLQPSWSLVYGPLYLFLILLPVFVVHQQEHIRRTFLAYLVVWGAAYVCFMLYPTVAPRPDEVTGEGFGVWGLRFLYEADPPYNCFPSIHVGHSFVSALTCARVHRRLGRVALGCASLVAMSTLFTKQHYVVDVIGGVALACAGYALFLRSYPREWVRPDERRLAPLMAGVTAAIVGAGALTAWVAYELSRH